MTFLYDVLNFLAYFYYECFEIQYSVPVYVKQGFMFMYEQNEWKKLKICYASFLIQRLLDRKKELFT